jgi:OOP family OmpA-OmpF porin
MKKLVSYATLLTALISTNTLSATEIPSKLYIGAGYGHSSYDPDLSSSWASTKADDSSDYYNLYVGYDLNQYIAIEGGYYNLGEISYSSSSTGRVITQDLTETLNLKSTAEFDGFTIALAGHYPIIENISLFGKLGLMKWEKDTSGTLHIESSYKNANGDVTTEQSYSNYSGSNDDNDLFYGIGASYHFDKVAINAEYSHFEFDSLEVDTFGISISYHFK